MMNSRKKATTLTLWLLAMLISLPAVAQDDALLQQNIERRIAEGNAAIERNEHEAARLAYEQAYALKKDKDQDLLRSLGAAEVLSGHSLKGARHLLEWLEQFEFSSRPEDVKAVREALEHAEKSLGTLRFEANLERTQISVDGEIVGVTPLSQPWYVEPGEHTVVALRGDREETKVLAISAGDVKTVEFDWEAREPGTERDSPTAPREFQEQRRPWILIAGLSTSAVAAAVGAYYLFDGMAAESDAEDLYTRTGSSNSACVARDTLDCLELEEKRGQRDQSYEIAMGAGIAAAVIAGTSIAAWYLFPEKSDTSVALTVGPQTLSLKGTF